MSFPFSEVFLSALYALTLLLHKPPVFPSQCKGVGPLFVVNFWYRMSDTRANKDHKSVAIPIGTTSLSFRLLFSRRQSLRVEAFVFG